MQYLSPCRSGAIIRQYQSVVVTSSSNFQKCIPNITNRTHTTSTSKKNDNNHVKIVEVGPRDGLQNETRVISTNAKVYLIQKLMDSGCKTIETASFVSPKWIPAMANSKEVMEELYHWRKEKNKKTKGEDEDSVIFSVLTPNLKGFENAMSIGKSDDNDSDDDDDDGIRAVDEVAIFGAASESFSQKNIACSIEESIQRFQKVTQAAKHHTPSPIPVRGYISCVLGCPYEGRTIKPSQVAKVVEQMLELGVVEISLGDTIGIGTVGSTIEMLKEVKTVVDVNNIAVHFHDTYGQALPNIYAALNEGIRTVDSSVAGLGGCPYAVGSSGNVATEDVVYMLHGMGMTTGIDLDKLVEAGSYICNELDMQTRSKCALALAQS